MPASRRLLSAASSCSSSSPGRCSSAIAARARRPRRCRRVRSSPPSAPSRGRSTGFVAGDRATWLLTMLLHARLVQLNQRTQDIEPALATKWTLDPDGRTYTLTPAPGRGVLGRHAVHGRRRRLHLPGPLRPEGRGPARQQPAGERTTPRRQEGRRPHGGADAAGPVWTWPAPPEQPAHPARAQAARRPGQGRVRQGVVDGDAAGRDHRPRARTCSAPTPPASASSWSATRATARAGPTSSPRSSA